MATRLPSGDQCGFVPSWVLSRSSTCLPVIGSMDQREFCPPASNGLPCRTGARRVAQEGLPSDGSGDDLPSNPVSHNSPVLDCVSSLVPSAVQPSTRWSFGSESRTASLPASRSNRTYRRLGSCPSVSYHSRNRLPSGRQSRWSGMTNSGVSRSRSTRRVGSPRLISAYAHRFPRLSPGTLTQNRHHSPSGATTAQPASPGCFTRRTTSKAGE